MTADPLARLRSSAAAREAAGLRRWLRPRPVDGDGLLDLASNDYLGLARHPQVVAGAVRAAQQWGAGATGSRLVTGSTALHAELETALAEFVGAERCLVFSSGYLANLATVASLAGRGDLVVSDAQNHASIVDACRLSRARVVITPHRDVGVVEQALTGRSEPNALVVTDSVFSVDGELAPLVALYDVARRHGALLVTDEAHAVGVVGPGGRGVATLAGLAGAPDLVVTATLSKSLGSQGGALLGATEVVQRVIDLGRAFIFDTGLAPACAGAAMAALRLLAAEPALADRVRVRARPLAATATAAGLPARPPEAAVVGVPIGEPARAVAAAERCAGFGVRVGCFRPPSVPDGVSRLRLTARADLGPADLELAAVALKAAAAAVSPPRLPDSPPPVSARP